MNYSFEDAQNREDTNAEKYTLRKKLFGTEDLLPMWVADMDIDTPPCVVEAIKNRIEKKIFGYEEMPSSAFEAQIDWMKSYHDYHIEQEHIFYSHSVVASINVAIQSFSEIGDKVIVQTPIYPPFMHSVTNNDRHLITNPLKKDADGHYSMDFEHLRSIIDEDTKLLLLCSPHNPVGRVWSRSELEELASICLENNIVIFSDEIHSDLIHLPSKHTTLASLSKDIEQISVSAFGPGKTFNLAGFAISTVVIANDELRARFSKTYENIHFAQGNIFGHIAFESAYRGGKAWLDALLQHLGKNFDKLEKLIAKHNDKIAFVRPEGTYLAWLDCTQMGLKDKALREFFVKEAKLGLSPGISFGRNGSGYMRMNCAVSSKRMDEALLHLDKALSLY